MPLIATYDARSHQKIQVCDKAEEDGTISRGCSTYYYHYYYYALYLFRLTQVECHLVQSRCETVGKLLRIRIDLAAVVVNSQSGGLPDVGQSDDESLANAVLGLLDMGRQVVVELAGHGGGQTDGGLIGRRGIGAASLDGSLVVDVVETHQ